MAFAFRARHHRLCRSALAYLLSHPFPHISRGTPSFALASAWERSIWYFRIGSTAHFAIRRTLARRSAVRSRPPIFRMLHFMGCGTPTSLIYCGAGSRCTWFRLGRATPAQLSPLTSTRICCPDNRKEQLPSLMRLCAKPYRSSSGTNPVPIEQRSD
jgi:hypothetical protein